MISRIGVLEKQYAMLKLSIKYTDSDLPKRLK